MKTQTTQDNAPSDIIRPLSDHCGIIRASTKFLPEICPGITIDECDTQGYLRNTGVFSALHQTFLLPESYVVRYVFAEHFGRMWAILVESPDLPSTPEGEEFPSITPSYCRTKDGVAHLVSLEVQARRSIPVPNGLHWLAKAL